MAQPEAGAVATLQQRCLPMSLPRRLARHPGDDGRLRLALNAAFGDDGRLLAGSNRLPERFLSAAACLIGWLAGWTYPLICRTESGELAYDNYQGGLCSGCPINRADR